MKDTIANHTKAIKNGLKKGKNVYCNDKATYAFALSVWLYLSLTNDGLILGKVIKAY